MKNKIKLKKKILKKTFNKSDIKTPNNQYLVQWKSSKSNAFFQSLSIFATTAYFYYNTF